MTASQEKSGLDPRYNVSRYEPHNADVDWVREYLKDRGHSVTDEAIYAAWYDRITIEQWAHHALAGHKFNRQ